SAPHGVDLPVARDLPGLNIRGPLVNHSLALHPPATFRAVVALAPLVASAQLDIQLAAGAPVTPNVPVDGLKADPELTLPMQRAGDLLGAPLLLEQFLYPGVLRSIMVRAAATASQSAITLLLGFTRAVDRQSAGYVLGSIAPALAIDRAAVAA